MATPFLEGTIVDIGRDSVTFQYLLIATMVAPSFLIYSLYCISSLMGLSDKWGKNLKRREQRKAKNNVRLFFNEKGKVVADQLFHMQNLEQAEHIKAVLKTLVTGHAFGSAKLFKLHPKLKSANDVAERCHQGVCNFLGREKSDLALVSSFYPMETLLDSLLDGKDAEGDIGVVLNQFKEQVAVLHAAFGESETSRHCWTHQGEATNAIKEALLGDAKASGGSVPDFPKDPIPGLANKAVSLIKARGDVKAQVHVMAHQLEPSEIVDGVKLRMGGCLFKATQMRDQFGIGSVRVILGVIALLMAVGPVRFLGVITGSLALLVVAFELFLECLRAGERSGSSDGGFCGAIMVRKHRIILPLILGGIVVFCLRDGLLHAPVIVDELQHKPTFLPCPPQYAEGINANQRSGAQPIDPNTPLVKVGGSTAYIAIIFGVMHGVLFTLCLIPLPICYGIQARFADKFPSFRTIIPRNPVWLHRMLGFIMCGGLLGAGMVWLVVQGFQCFFGDQPQTCDAFLPVAQFGKDVFVLRFHIVWPLTFFFIPFMIFDKYPEDGKEAEATAKSRAALAPADSGKAREVAAADRQSEDRHAASSSKAPEPEKDKKKHHGIMDMGKAALKEVTGHHKDHKDAHHEDKAPLLADAREKDIEKAGAAAANRKARTDAVITEEVPVGWLQRISGFLSRRIQDICLIATPVAGTIVSIQGAFSCPDINVFLPFWCIVLFLAVFQTILKFRSFLAEKCSFLQKWLDPNDGWTEFLRKSWWEIAYVSHTIAFSVMVFFALWIRLTVFWPTLFTWGLYFLDRGLGIYAACKNKTPIIVGEARSSYVVSKGDGSRSEPSHVRLVVKRPPGFEYKAGQWAHVALHHCGSHLKAPAWFNPMLQWHPFSIASSDHEDHLEFHIMVNGSQGVFDNMKEIRVSGYDQNLVNVSRIGKWVDSWFPYSVPFEGTLPSTGCSGVTYEASSSNIYMNLKTDSGHLKILKPQKQWTGRLWNTVQWMLDKQASGKCPEQLVQIMGPYGTLPHTVDAHKAVMLIGAGVGFPSTGSMLRKLLEDNLNKADDEKKLVCFLWTATKVDQLLLCFPSLLVDLTRYVHRKSLADLKKWLTIKIFISSFDAGDFLGTDPGKHLFPDGEAKTMAPAMKQVRKWLLGSDDSKGVEDDADGTYIASGSLGASFADILRDSLFTKNQVVAKKNSLGICFCGPTDLCAWIRSEQANTLLPVHVEFNSESAGG